MPRFLRLTLLLTSALCLPLASLPAAAPRPNILWIIVDDISPNFGCYGETSIRTPNVDALAKSGVLFEQAHTTAPVCSASRSALITGMYQTTIGAHNHRSNRGANKVRLPEGVELVPALFQKAGYYTCISDGKPDARTLGKTDYNFEWDRSVYNGPDWSGRKPGQPFFMQVQLLGGKHRDLGRWKELDAYFGSSATDPDSVASLPPYYPRDPVILADWAHYLDSMRMTDIEVGRVMDRLKAEGLLENTLIILIGDHGVSHARGKQFLYTEGTRIPFIISGPGVRAGQVRKDLIEQIDMAATSLAAAGIPIPKTMQARDVLDPSYEKRDAVFSARDRCDETVDRIRSVRTDRWLYIRNYYPLRPHLQPNAYKDSKPILIRLRELHAAGTLDSLSERLLFAPTRAPEELYEWIHDRWEINNLASEPSRWPVLAELRGRLDRWIVETNDQGRFPESKAVYEGNVRTQRHRDNAAAASAINQNIETMLRWQADGR